MKMPPHIVVGDGPGVRERESERPSVCSIHEMEISMLFFFGIEFPAVASFAATTKWQNFEEKSSVCVHLAGDGAGVIERKSFACSAKTCKWC